MSEYEPISSQQALEGLLAKLSIIILSKDRNAELSQTISYWAATPISVIVVHDSKSPIEISTSWKNVNYLKSSDDILMRLALAYEHVNTPYVMIGNDDEIFLPVAISHILTLLESDPAFESAAGQTVAYSWAGNRLLGASIYNHLLNYRNVDISPFRRTVKTLDSRNLMDLTAIYRRSEFGAIVTNCRDFSGFSTPYMYEMMFAVFSSCFCRTTRVSNIYWVRNWHTPFQDDSFGWDRRTTWGSWWESKELKDEHARWESLFRAKLVSLNRLNAEELEEIVLQLKTFNPTVRVTRPSRVFAISKVLLNTIRKTEFGKFASWKIQSLIPWRKRHVMLDFNSLILSEEFNLEIDISDLMKVYSYVTMQKKLPLGINQNIG